MESPSSTRRLTKTQAFSPITIFDSISKNHFQTEESGICQSRRKNIEAQKDKRSPLIDITNDSPIIGLAMQTPPSGFMCTSKSRSRIKNTPGSGEALLRGQVKTLLHKVEEEEGAELINSIKTLPFIHQSSEIYEEKEGESVSVTRSLLLDFMETTEFREVLHLKGIPTPKGKHSRFATDEE